MTALKGNSTIGIFEFNRPSLPRSLMHCSIILTSSKEKVAAEPRPIQSDLGGKGGYFLLPL